MNDDQCMLEFSQILAWICYEIILENQCCYSGLYRCGLLTFHVRLPYSVLQKPYVESAIRATYQKNICNCTVSVKVIFGKMDGPSK